MHIFLLPREHTQRARTAELGSPLAGAATSDSGHRCTAEEAGDVRSVEPPASDSGASRTSKAGLPPKAGAKSTPIPKSRHPIPSYPPCKPPHHPQSSTSVAVVPPVSAAAALIAVVEAIGGFELVFLTLLALVSSVGVRALASGQHKGGKPVILVVGKLPRGGALDAIGQLEAAVASFGVIVREEKSLTRRRLRRRGAGQREGRGHVVEVIQVFRNRVLLGRGVAR
mmetsp:Transcript_12949/g.29810  ORF Transcript_12949/g.29810 Transcript_12949/m.29810 type:complete len:226 (-) Transcript_12949:79-756(-)